MNTSQLAEIEVEIMHGCLEFIVHITTQIQLRGGGEVALNYITPYLHAICIIFRSVLVVIIQHMG